ncbi:glycoside hydrolase domain-containing protein [Bacillus alkalicellulosilyticus]|uniref:glycoside hydrolase domain-containing protein n=1 Tax=Alkalihalobacterium alkalicellulosilyticum TaxID=1912214 RepID=UPI001FED262E|nr:glycoside hydrolase domain-containing protein [Bacillus alkalicellulosilyticus]
MRQYIILGVVYLLALASFFFFVASDYCDCEINVVTPITPVFQVPTDESDDDETNGTEEENGEEQEETETNGRDEDNGEDQDSESNGREEEDTDENGESNGRDEDEDSTNGTVRDQASGDEILWGVDSASLTDQEFFACVINNFGDPVIWGRYLEDKDGVSFGLITEEVELLHDNGVSILVIYNHFTDGTTYEKGVSEAETAIEYAQNIGVPEGVAIFANVEPFYPIDSAFIQGWYDTIDPSEYTPAIYGVFSPDGDNNVRIAFEAAVDDNPEILDNTIIWTNQPQIGITTEANAPEFDPQGPENALTWAWQYGIDAETCNIDTVLYESAILDFVWSPED